MSKKKIRNSNEFLETGLLNTLTYLDYIKRFTTIALSMFEWVNLPDTMDADYLEKTLYYYGQATLLKDKNYGFINTKCCTSGKINLYEKPTALNCYSYEYSTTRKLYNPINSILNKNEYTECILVKNNILHEPTYSSMELFAWRLYNAERVADINIMAQKTPIFILTDEKQRLTFKNLFEQYDGNIPLILGDKYQLTEAQIRAIKTDAPFVADKITDYKKEIWNESLTFLGINNLMVDKKERLVSDEANSNNELINYNLQSRLAPRLEACKQFNKKYELEGTEAEISVRLRSDLHNIIKNAQSNVNDYNINIKEGENNG